MIQVLDTNTYFGPNIYSDRPTFRWRIDLTELRDWPLDKLGGSYLEALLAEFPALSDDSDHARAIRALFEQKSVPICELLRRLADFLQFLAGHSTAPGEVRDLGDGQYDILIEYFDPLAADGAMRLANSLIMHVLPQDLRPNLRVLEGFNFHTLAVLQVDNMHNAGLRVEADII